VSSVDVFVPCYRYGHFLRQCVESVLSQSGVSVRVLIIDEASPDNTAEVAAALASEDPLVSFIRHIENKGHIATYNEGIEWASADYMLLLSADDYLLPGALSRAAELMDAHPEVGFTFGNVIELTDNGIERPFESIINPTDDPDKRILEGRINVRVSPALLQDRREVLTLAAIAEVTATPGCVGNRYTSRSTITPASAPRRSCLTRKSAAPCFEDSTRLLLASASLSSTSFAFRRACKHFGLRHVRTKPQYQRQG
jgi:cellulose synthase/poly-beta-1,6-N-acetylglucosamine synthase-like glycosyltransferase